MIGQGPTCEQEQASAVIEEVIGWQAHNVKAVAQLHPE